MKISQHKRRFSWVLTTAFALVTCISNASWECPDGTPCGGDCSMTRAHHSARAGKFASVRCSHCPVDSTVISRDCNVFGCGSSGCVLRSSDRPDASISRGVTIPLATVDLQPLLVSDIAAPSPQFIDRYELGFFPQHFLRSHFGRSPPANVL